MSYDAVKGIMSRPLRKEYPDAWYHVMNRGRWRESVFRKKEDYLAFIDPLKDTFLRRSAENLISPD
jgi:hypothetical protein